ncbi:PmoA family protein [Marinactinospora endophytica]
MTRPIPTSPTSTGRQTPTLLRVAGRVVAEHHDGTGLEPRLAPRPHLHPVSTLAGTVVTETRPADHPHHLGVGVAVPDAGGTNFWGGRTFVRDQGPTWLDDHGAQLHRAWSRRHAEEHTELISWQSRDGEEVIAEERRTRALALDERAWTLVLDVGLRNVCGGELRLASPAVKGRPGAGYGGFFWRAPRAALPPRCLGPGVEGESALHGSTAAWLALLGARDDGARWTLVFTMPGEERDPWFLRAGEYPGVGTALAWDRPRSIGAGEVLRRRVVTVVADGHPSPAELERLAATARERAADPGEAG